MQINRWVIPDKGLGKSSHSVDIKWGKPYKDCNNMSSAIMKQLCSIAESLTVYRWHDALMHDPLGHHNA